MRRRTPARRFLALLWATLRVTSPAAAARADGMPSGQGASAALSHVESKTTASCPEIHAVDCAICRYLSNVAAAVPSPTQWLVGSVELPPASGNRCAPHTAWRTLPHGRAPPTV